MIDKAAFSPSSKFAKVATHQAIYKADEHVQQEQRRGQYQNGQAHYEGKGHIHRGQHEILNAHVELVDPASEAFAQARRPRLPGKIRKASLDQQPLIEKVQYLDDRLSRLLEDE